MQLVMDYMAFRLLAISKIRPKQKTSRMPLSTTIFQHLGVIGTHTNQLSACAFEEHMLLIPHYAHLTKN